MLVNKINREELYDLFQVVKLQSRNAFISKDNEVKIEQIIAYLEIIHSELRRVSKKRPLVLIDSGAGNCYLSYLVYYFYRHIENRPIQIFCIDNNERLMQLNRDLAKRMNFEGMSFYASDIEDFAMDGPVDVVYSLHACDTATDKSIYLGLRTKAKVILSVSCCQHSLSLKSQKLKAVIRHKAFRDKALMMISDSLRALLLEQMGYKVGIFDFVSSRYTEKNTMIRAKRTEFKKQIDFEQEYRQLSDEFGMQPFLETLIAEKKNHLK
ncbi:SAM-dependent methyltransferase [Carboxylicivirga sp. M1479]|uniref:class I SAM-dependent methyltransferase n=1 Tax=Carboxylicivirga sp. M1479 TaxID=2594476 RepID=UPI0011775491|nr:SAM-dependent methyltransferase [Carboxylicivirga sp. M1479]TRX66006.1 SAM-dependent methyltransferase [Carboxylicivirga sp. M1479]